MSIRLALCFWIVAATWAGAQEAATKPTAEATAFFEKEVRPILVEHCQSCHGEKKQEAGLRLDSAAAFQKGSDSGPVALAAQPADGLLWQAIHYAGDTKMPPDGKLPAPALEALSNWLKLGAPWPAEENKPAASARPSIQEIAKTHWSLQPVRTPAIPERKQGEWGSGAIDALVLAKLKEAGLSPSLPEDRRTLLRRVTLDLHGLPPTFEEVQAFEKDDSPQAWEKVINRLLDSPRYGERWGRHWLDVARYADTKGYVRLRDNPRYVSGWTYRDYVIRAFNEDLPYDQFVMQQLAADQLPTAKTDPRTLAAMGFLTLGQRFLNSQHDILDDRIDVVTRGLLGLTVACARCHDHKFDPISIRDYYSLHGIFASSAEPHIPPLIATTEELPRYEAYKKELDRRLELLDQFMKGEQAKLQLSFREKIGEYMLASYKEKVQANFVAVMFLIDAKKDLNPVMIQRWARLFEKSRQKHHPVLAPWNALAALNTEGATADGFSQHAEALIKQWSQSASSELPLNSVVVAALAQEPPKSKADVAKTYGKILKEADAKWKARLAENPAATALDEPAWESLRQLLYGADAPPEVALSDVEEFLFVDTTTQNQLHEQQRLVEDWIASPEAAPHAHMLVDAAVPVTPRVFLRGNASNPGEVVARQFLEVLSQDKPGAFQQGSGRLELAQAIASPTNPLTARVLVNRVWAEHFGQGLVRTPSDFGLRGEAPTHPELLDYLTEQFIKEGWSIKKLHRHILLSGTYQQQSADVALGMQKDPENRLLWRMNRRRLDWEAMRDSFLAASGSLDLSVGGPSVQILTPPFSARRSVYGFIDRQHLPSVLRTFDFAAPDTSVPQRHHTTVPQQALFLMNGPFLKEQTQKLAALPEFASALDDGARVDRLYQRLFGRLPSAEEKGIALKYLAEATADKGATPGANYFSPWQEYVQAILLTNEFLFVD